MTRYILCGADGRLETSSHAVPVPRCVGDVLYETDPDQAIDVNRTLEWDGDAWIPQEADWSINPRGGRRCGWYPAKPKRPGRRKP